MDVDLLTTGRSRSHRRPGRVARAARSIAGGAVLAALIALGGCAWVHKPELQQGNVVTAEMLSRVEHGMSRREVQSFLGTPLVTDVFHEGRWDYYYRLIPDNKADNDGVIHNRVTVFFEGDKLVRVENRITHDTTR